MTLTIGHFSDLHGNINKLFAVQNKSVDVWVCTGDFFPNSGYAPDAASERAFQLNWLHAPQRKGSVMDRLVAMFGDTPVICVSGNHDYIDLTPELRSVGVNAHHITDEGVTVCGLVWAGFPEVPFIVGDWVGEVQRSDLQQCVYHTMQSNPDVLVTHAPPAGILDNDNCCGHGHGIEAITTAIAYTDHQVKMHLFGHVHAQGGHTENMMGVQFINGAGCVRFHTL